MDNSKVSPSEPVAAQDIQVSACDAYAIKGWVTHTLFWPLRGPVDESYKILKEGLSRTLSEIPALAGNLRRGSGGPRSVYIELKEGAHVDFTYEDLSAKDDIPSYDKLKESGFPMTALRAPTSPMATLGPVLEDSPMMVAKLGKLKNGLAMTVGFNHVLADGATAMEIEKIWALHTKDAFSRTSKKQKIETPDAMIRERLSTPPIAAGKMPTDVWRRVPAEETFMHLHKNAASFGGAFMKVHKEKMMYLASTGGTAKETFWCIWEFSAKNLEQLKKDASVADPDLWISTGDALTGLLWSRLASILKSSAKGHTTSTAVFNMNIRSRLDPPIPNEYIGNVVATILADCPLSELESSDTGMKIAAQSVRKAVKGWSQEEWKAWLHEITTLPDDQVLGMNRQLMFEPHRVGFNDFSKFLSNTNDWGEGLGVVDSTRYARPAAVHAGGAVGIWIYPKKLDGSLEVALSLSDEQRQALDDDEVFRRYAEYVCSHP